MRELFKFNQMFSADFAGKVMSQKTIYDNLHDLHIK